MKDIERVIYLAVMDQSITAKNIQNQHLEKYVNPIKDVHNDEDIEDDESDVSI
ncbi:hypothetical protein BG003_010570 [Podila horticola]|nr:hypothetical protein BG003_010570 [Podila horticola]